LHTGTAMYARAAKIVRVTFILFSAFVLGGASAEVAVRTQRAVVAARAEREVGAAGQLVALQLTDLYGQVVARPRLICPKGKTAELVLHDPANPEQIRLTFRVEAERDPSGEIALDYELWIPERAVSAKGKISLTPGAEQAISLGDGELVATWLALPVPSTQFDAFMEAERSFRLATGKPT
jgi:hypothetical protein